MWVAVGRREKPIEPEGPVQRFALELRKLRVEAGSPPYRVMAEKAGYSVAALARAAAGELLPSLPLTLAYVKACGADVEEWERRWTAVREEDAARPRPQGEESADPPYRGLARFEPGDHARFFGRARLTDDLTALTGTHRFVMVLGPSGSGKSSLLRAGLIPRLRQSTDPGLRPAAIRIFTPGPRPVREHRKLFTPAEGAGDTWLVVDQFEEVFTLCHDEAERQEFVDLLLSARDPGSRLRAVVGVRADFYAHCLEHDGLSRALGEVSLPVGPMTPDELREVIVKPAAAEGLVVERSLTARLIQEVGEERGGLPLLSHTLLETWRRRRGRTLTLDGYEATGGIHGAIAQTAEDLYTRLSPSQAEAARRILLRLITPGDGTPDTRRPVGRAELRTTDRAEQDQDALLQRLARARLITLDDGIVDLAHEALITAWPRLRRWIEDNRERLRRHRHLTDAARNWQERGRDNGALLRGTALTEAEDAFRTRGQRDELTPLERDFLHHSARAEQRRSRRARSRTAALATLLVLALIAAVTAYQQHSDAEQRRLQADTARLQAQAGELAAQSGTLTKTNPDLASLLAVQAYRTSPTAEARISLYKAADLPLRYRLEAAEKGAVVTAYSPGGRTLATGSSDGTVRLWDPSTGRLRGTVTGHRGQVLSLAFSRDGRTLFIGGSRGTVWRGNVRTGRVHTAFRPHQEESPRVFSPDGRTVAMTDSKDRLRLRDIRTGRTGGALGGPAVVSAVFSPDSRTLAAVGLDGKVRLWDTATGKARTTLADFPEEVTALAFTRDGKSLATGSSEGSVRLWDAATGRARTSYKGRHDGEVHGLAFSPDGRSLATGGWGTLQLWDTATGRSRAVLAGHKGAVDSAVFSPDSRTLATGGNDGTARLWDVRTGRTLTGHKGAVDSVTFSSDGRRLATGSEDGSVRLWDTRTGRTSATLTGSTGPAAPVVAFGAGGRTLVAADSYSGSVRIHDVRTGRTRTTLTDPEYHFSGPTTLSPDGRTLLTGGADAYALRLRDSRTGRTRVKLTNPKVVNSAVFTPDGHTVAVGNGTGTWTRLWDVRTGRVRADFSGRDGWTPLAFSPDGRTLATTGTDGTVRLRDVGTGHRRVTLAGSGGVVPYAVAFSPDGHTLAIADGAETVQLWDTTTGRVRATLTHHTGAEGAALVFSPDGHTLAGTAGKTVELWEVRLPGPEAAERKICRAVARDLTAEERATYLAESPKPACKF